MFASVLFLLTPYLHYMKVMHASHALENSDANRKNKTVTGNSKRNFLIFLCNLTLCKKGKQELLFDFKSKGLLASAKGIILCQLFGSIPWIPWSRIVLMSGTLEVNFPCFYATCFMS